MQIGALSFRPYIYNANYISADSLGKVSGIGDDLVTSGTDYSSLVDDSLNENPLRKGETSNFMDVLQMQFQMGQMNASRLIKPAEETDAARQDLQLKKEQQADMQTDMISDIQQDMQADGAEEMQENNPVTEAVNMQMDRNLYMMQKAAEAYRVNMIA